MISNHLSVTWTALAPALGNHLWQSTLFAITAGLLTLMLRKNHARVRYWLWLAASARFLIPFSLLVGIGSYLPWSHGVAGTKAGFYFAMEEVTQPFTQPTVSMIPQSTASAGLIHLLPAVLAAMWLCGFLVVISQWYFRWWRISAAIRKAVPLKEGREVQALRRLERMGRMRKRTEMLVSQTSLEPGIFGITRPVLIWPEGISERLEDAHLEAILAHELCHVRRHDNLAAAIHMVVEAIFWFHPLVWWLEARLMEEREHACDEEVLASGSDRQVYAESILKICEFCVGSPLACVSGVTGADLKKRIARIMTESFARKLDFRRKLFLSAAALAAIALPILFGPLRATRARAESQAQTAAFAPAFENASIKPNNGTPMAGFSIVGKPFAGIMWKADRFMATNFTLHKLIQRAYDVQDDQILGGPDWVNSEGYDIDAKVEKSVVDELQRLGPDQRVLRSRRMLQELLADRFKLTLHHETKEVPAYLLVIAKDGAKLQEAKPGDTYPDGFKDPHGRPLGAGTLLQPGPCKLVGQGIPIASLARDLSQLLGRAVVDQTGLNGVYDFTVDCHTAFMERGDSLLTVLPEQLGLELKPQTAPVEVLAIDHAEKPADPQAQNTAIIPPAFEVASIRLNKAGTASLKTGNGIISQRLNIEPGTFTAVNISMWELIRLAYRVEDYQVSGAPDWFASELYDVDAKAEKSAIDEMQKLGNDQRQLEKRRMLQTLLKGRFKLTLRQVTKDLPIYSLVVADAGKLHEAQGDCAPGPTTLVLDSRLPPCGSLRVFPWVGRMDGLKVPITQLVANLSGFTKRMVLDNTSLGGKYDITLKWFPGPSEFPPRPAYLPPTYQPDPNSPPLLTAIQQQLGLKLDSQIGPVPLLVIDHVEKPPSEN
jgi:uncharacterized protein (TIGR03435 family)